MEPGNANNAGLPSQGMSRVHVHIHGRVQGVGFRAFVQEIGARLELTGWVRNVGYDGVEAAAEGHRSALEHFIEEARRGPRSARVDDFRVDWETATGEFSRFEMSASR
ncbi:MAG: acylphosphatase [Anaerolineaceae bacterium]|nr:MAG: acylphosphatase [Anaerolineaceae bacterium]